MPTLYLAITREKGSKTPSAETDKRKAAETQNRVKLESNMLKRKDRKENQVAGKQDIGYRDEMKSDEEKKKSRRKEGSGGREEMVLMFACYSSTNFPPGAHYSLERNKPQNLKNQQSGEKEGGVCGAGGWEVGG